MRVFLDTNVLVSALATRGLCEDVLRNKFKIPTAIVSEILNFLKQDTLSARAGTLPDIKLKDRDDLVILSCALQGKADIFVTGDKELIELRKIRNIEIVSPRGFWKKMKNA